MGLLLNEHSCDLEMKLLTPQKESFRAAILEDGLAVRISKKARPVRSVGLVVYSYLGDSLLSSAGLNQEGKQRCLCWFPCPS